MDTAKILMGSKIMSEIKSQGLQVLEFHIREFFADKIGKMPSRELAILAATDYVKRYMVPDAEYKNTFEKEVILWAASHIEGLAKERG
jgi:hypothetical protein